jgi:hypothetical protein
MPIEFLMCEEIHPKFRDVNIIVTEEEMNKEVEKLINESTPDLKKAYSSVCRCIMSCVDMDFDKEYSVHSKRWDNFVCDVKLWFILRRLIFNKQINIYVCNTI